MTSLWQSRFRRREQQQQRYAVEIYNTVSHSQVNFAIKQIMTAGSNASAARGDMHMKGEL
jgi:hypothetical protein